MSIEMLYAKMLDARETARRIAMIGAVLLLAGCGPDFPDDERHSGVSNDDCIACHVDGEYEGAPRPSDRHWDDGDLERDDCKSCHDRE